MSLRDTAQALLRQAHGVGAPRIQRHSAGAPLIQRHSAGNPAVQGPVDRPVTHYEPEDYETANLTMAGLPYLNIVSGAAPVTFPVYAIRPIVLQKLVIPSTIVGLVLWDASIQKVGLLASAEGNPIVLDGLSEVSLVAQQEWPAIDQRTPMLLTVSNPAPNHTGFDVDRIFGGFAWGTNLVP